MNHLEALERLHRLKESGALSEAEFAEQKARLLAAGNAGPAEPAAEWDVQSRSGNSSGLIAALAGGGLAAVLGAIAWWAMSGDQQPAALPSDAATDASAAVTATQPAALSSLPLDEQLRLASLAALGFEGKRTSKDGTQKVITKAERVLNLPFGTVLLTSTERPDDCHACTGYVGVYYLADEGGKYRVTGRWPKALAGWGWGAAPNWKISTAYTSNPAIVAEGAYTGQGYTCTGMNIVELTSKGPVESDVISLGMSNEGAVDPETGTTMGGEPLRELTGKIVNVQKGKSLQVEVSGNEAFTETYVMRGGKFVRTSGETKLGC